MDSGVWGQPPCKRSETSRTALKLNLADWPCGVFALCWGYIAGVGFGIIEDGPRALKNKRVSRGLCWSLLTSTGGGMMLIHVLFACRLNGGWRPSTGRLKALQPIHSDTKNEACNEWNRMQASGASQSLLEKRMTRSYQACAIARNG